MSGTTLTFDVAAAKFSMAVAKPESVLTLVSESILIYTVSEAVVFGVHQLSLEERAIMFLLRITFINNPAAAKPKVSTCPLFVYSSLFRPYS
jgi:hypothetical protein